MLKGAEALALCLSGPRAVHATAAPAGPLGRVQRLLLREGAEGAEGAAAGPWPAPSDAVTLGRCLGGALLAAEPGFALLGPAGLLGSLGTLATLGQLGDLRAGAVLIDGAEADPRGALQAAAPLPLLEAGGADELGPLTALALELSEASGVPVALRVAPRALRERTEARGVALRAPAPRPLPLALDEGPYLTEGAAAFLLGRRAARLLRMAPHLLPLAARTAGAPGRRGVVLGGHLGRRAQARASGRGLATLRLGCALPLPEAALRDFCAPLDEVLVLEEGAPYLLPALQALCHRAGLGARVVGASALAARLSLRLDEAALELELDRFAGPGRGDGPAPPYELPAPGRLPSLRPELDAQGELDEEPWPLHLARLRRELAPLPPGDGRLSLLLQLRALERPIVALSAPGPAFGPPPGPALCDVQPPRGCVAAVAGALGRPGEAAAPLPVALLLSEGDLDEELPAMLDNAATARDVLHLVLQPRVPGGAISGAAGAAAARGALGAQLAAAGMEVLRADLAEEGPLRRALGYLVAGRGPRALLCSADLGADSQLSG